MIYRILCSIERYTLVYFDTVDEIKDRVND